MLDALVSHSHAMRFKSWVLNLFGRNHGKTGFVVVLFGLHSLIAQLTAPFAENLVGLGAKPHCDEDYQAEPENPEKKSFGNGA